MESSRLLLEELNRQQTILETGHVNLTTKTVNGISTLEDQRGTSYSETLRSVRESLIIQMRNHSNLSDDEEAESLNVPFWMIPTFYMSSWFLEPGDNKKYSKRIAALQEQQWLRFDWDEPHLIRWASSEESSLILMQGSYSKRGRVDISALELIDSLEAQCQDVVWILNPVPKQEGIKWDGQTFLRHVACQILRKNKSFRSPKASLLLANVMQLFNNASTMDDWFHIIRASLESCSVVYIVLNLGILGINARDAEQWPEEFLKSFSLIRQQLGSILKVILFNTHTFRKPQSGHEPGFTIVHLDSRFKIISGRTDSSKDGESLFQLPTYTLRERSQRPVKKLCNENELDTIVDPVIDLSKMSQMLNVLPDIHHEPAKEQFAEPEEGSFKFVSAKLPSRRPWNRDGWFAHMRLFERCVDASRKEPDELHPRVKIAIFDTGLDSTHRDIINGFEENRLKYHDFVDNVKDAKDLDGHGTHCTSLLLKYAPNAEIFAGRVFVTCKSDEKSASILAEGILHAVNEWNVDIISMSLGFTNHIPEVHDAIMKAYSKEVLIFAAAANNTTNENTPIRFPARMREVICIFSCSTDGRNSDFNPDATSKMPNFTVPGEKINGAWPATIVAEGSFEYNGDTYRAVDGTSSATPLAAVIAAGILEFGWQERSYDIRNKKLLKNFTGMTDIFKYTMVDDYVVGQKRYHYLKPWKLISTHRRKEDIASQISVLLDDC